MNCEVEEEDVAHREATVRGTGKRGRNGKTGGDDGKETDQKGHDDVKIGRRAMDRSGRCSLEQDHPGVSERTGPACGRVVILGSGGCNAFALVTSASRADTV